MRSKSGIHVLVNSASAALAKLAKDKFIMVQRGFSPAMYESIFASCRRAGFVPQVEQEVPQIVSVLPLVAAGFGVSIVPRTVSELQLAGVRYIDVEGDVPRASVGLVYRRDERSATITNVIKVARLAKLRRN